MFLFCNLGKLILQIIMVEDWLDRTRLMCSFWTKGWAFGLICVHAVLFIYACALHKSWSYKLAAQPPFHLSVTHSPLFLLHLSTTLPAATHLRTEQRKWGNQLQSGGGGCVRTIIVPGGTISLWIAGSFMEVLNPVGFFLFLSQSIGGLFAVCQTMSAPSEGVTARSRDILIKHSHTHRGTESNIWPTASTASD